ncbi:MAG: serine/threonine protein kinase, partial [Deltaproteobacteria bacterium]|nr:serine/threonine protein kinase [Deltaproteobacteria bacterium]
MSQPEVTRKFHFLREIASGGFGSVFLAKVVHSDGFSRLAAIKLLHPKWSENEEIASRMRDEARLLGQLRHKNIVDVLDLTMIDGRVAVIMEYLEAVDLRTVITDTVDHGELVPTRVALEIAGCVASALDAAFNRPPIPGEKPLRVIHRDIKPTNVMVDESGTPKVLDFGVARADFEERESHTQDIAFGSIEYMPPERLFFEPESPASDVYSLAVTLFEVMALEKFGKAKLRPNQHDELIFKRLRYLFGRNKVGTQEVRNAVKVLLRDMLAFDEADRPSAAQVVERTRAITRMSRKEETLAEWSEVMMPPLIEAQRNRQQEGSPNPLVDQVLEEGSYGFRRTPTEELFSDRT